MEYCIIGACRCGTTSLQHWLKDYNIQGHRAPLRFLDDNFPLDLYNLNKKCKIIMLVRKPAERAYAHWLYTRVCRPADEVHKFSDAIRIPDNEYINQGLYHKNIQRFSMFSDIIIANLVDGDDVVVLQNVLDFLGHTYDESKERPVLNSAIGANHTGSMLDIDRTYLYNVFYQDQLELLDMSV